MDAAVEIYLEVIQKFGFKIYSYGKYNHSDEVGQITAIDDDGICLTLYNLTDEFMLTYNVPMSIQVLSTGKCGSFSKERRFSQMYTGMKSSVKKLSVEDDQFGYL